MMTRITAMSALALLAACGSASVAERDAAAQTREAAKPLTIEGLRIGMTATEARTTLARDGWKVDTEAGEDWAADLAPVSPDGFKRLQKPVRDVRAVNAF